MEIQSVDETEHEADDVAVDMSKLLLAMNKRLEGMASSAGEPKLHTIYRVPDSIRCEKHDYFDPAVVSIGPYHRSKPKYRAMEEQKWRFLRDFLLRNDSGIDLETCLQAIAPLEGKARRCYSEPNGLSANEFIEMLVLDGSFIIEFSFKTTEREQRSVLKEMGWSLTFVTRDFILLENQIPFFIIEELLKLAFPRKTEMATNLLCRVITNFLNPILPRSTAEAPTKPYHLLHVCHHYFVPDAEKRKASARKPSILQRFHSWVFTGSSVQRAQSPKIPVATQLREAGVKFKKKKFPDNFLDITFENGIMEIPSLWLYDEIKPLFMNLIAFEQCSRTENRYLSAFALFMDDIVNSKEDVLILEKSKIVVNFLSGEEEAATFFDQTGQGTFVADDYLAPLYDEVNKYYWAHWNKDRVELFRDYFGSPWATISVIAGAVLLLLTILQTIFTVLAYVYPPK